MKFTRALTLAVVVALCACSHETAGKGSEPGAASTPNTTDGPTGTTGLAGGDLPELDAAAIAPTNAALADPATAQWLDNALGVTRLDDVEICHVGRLTMDPAVAANITTLTDGVIAELLVDLDSALGGIALGCGARSTPTVDAELADARAAAAAVTARLVELGR